MLKFLGCPICKGAVKVKSTNAYCENCKKTFEIKNSIVIHKTKKKIGN